MAVSLDDLRDVGILISCALQPRLRPAVHPIYRGLLGRYRTEPGFRDATRSILDGMDLLVLSDAAELGLVLGPRRESLFAARLADVPNVTSVEHRLLVGLITAGIAAYAYPAPESFDDDRVRYVAVGDLERFLRQTCVHLQRGTAAPVDDEGLEEAWRTYERMPAVHRAERGRTTGRLSPACTTFWITVVLDWLTGQGMARMAERHGPAAYQLLERFRVQVGELAGHEAYRLLAVARRQDAGPDATVAPPDGQPADGRPGAGEPGSTGPDGAGARGRVQ